MSSNSPRSSFESNHRPRFSRRLKGFDLCPRSSSMVTPNHSLGVPGLSAGSTGFWILELARRKQRGEAPTATAHAEVYAGTGFWNSPSPSSLPLPRFSLKKDAPAVGEFLATVALRRMLRLE